MNQRQILLGIIKNQHATMYKEFLAYCQTRFVDENVQFLATLASVKNQIHGEIPRGVWATYVKEGAFWQVNLPGPMKLDIDRSIEEGTVPDFGPAESGSITRRASCSCSLKLY